LFKGPLAYIDTELNWDALEKNNGTREEVAQAYVGTLLANGFELRDGSLQGPPVNVSDGDQWQRLLDEDNRNLYLVKGPVG
jgi:hypothetical protein